MNKGAFLNLMINLPICFFLRIFLLLSIVDVPFCIASGAVFYSCYILAFNLLLSWVLSFCSKFLGRYIRLTYKFILYIILFLMCCIDLFCVLNMNSRFGGGFASIIAGTNMSEAREFLTTFVNFNLILALFAICIAFYSVPIIIGIMKTIINVSFHNVIKALLIITSTCFVLRSPDIWKESLIGKLYLLCESANIPNCQIMKRNKILL